MEHFLHRKHSKELRKAVTTQTTASTAQKKPNCYPPQNQEYLGIIWDMHCKPTQNHRQSEKTTNKKLSCWN